ncbi:hypothetical protein [Streptomyces sp. NPDC006551]|uniref:hypothetical protein n=1 Tax=Streptomyces sp. NPDC006551 TaxID=3157178 RepID=UPI0033BDE410
MTTTVPSSGDGATSAPSATGTSTTAQPTPDAGDAAAQAALEEQVKKEAMAHLRGWLVSSVLFALMPTLIQFLAGRQTAGYVQPDFMEMMSRAQLYLVSIGITIQALVQALMELRKSGAPTLVNLSLANLIILAAAIFLASTADGTDALKSVVGQQSLILFLTALAASGRSTWICAKEAALRDG